MSDGRVELPAWLEETGGRILAHTLHDRYDQAKDEIEAVIREHGARGLSHMIQAWIDTSTAAIGVVHGTAVRLLPVDATTFEAGIDPTSAGANEIAWGVHLFEARSGMNVDRFTELMQEMREATDASVLARLVALAFLCANTIATSPYGSSFGKGALN